MRKSLAACGFLILLAGCTGSPDYLVGRSPAMVSLCAKSHDIQSAIDAAQAHCEDYGKSAELIGSAAGVLDTSAECRSADGDYSGRIVHFRCVRE